MSNLKDSERTKISDSLRFNLARVENLILIYDRLGSPSQGRRTSHQTDILRSAVVFLHASLEEFIRQLVITIYPDSQKEIINRVPIAGSLTVDPQKFLLGELVQFKDMYVSKLIEDSVTAHSKRLTVNNTNDLSNMLQSLSFEMNEDVRRHFHSLAELMSRRHHIVHQADKNETSGSGQFKVKSISSTEVRVWLQSVRDCCSIILTSI